MITQPVPLTSFTDWGIEARRWKRGSYIVCFCFRMYIAPEHSLSTPYSCNVSLLNQLPFSWSPFLSRAPKMFSQRFRLPLNSESTSYNPSLPVSRPLFLSNNHYWAQRIQPEGLERWLGGSSVETLAWIRRWDVLLWENYWGGQRMGSDLVPCWRLLETLFRSDIFSIFWSFSFPFPGCLSGPFPDCQS